MSFRELIAYDAGLTADTFRDGNADGTPRLARYRKSGDGQIVNVRPITNRDPDRRQKEDKGRTLADHIEVQIPREDLDAVVEKQDTIELQFPGEATKWRPVTGILEATPGFWILAIGR